MDEFRREKTPCARKEHRCDLCHQMIAKGEKYVHIVSSDSGYIWDYKYHGDCYALIERYCRAEQPCDSYDDYLVIDDVVDRVCYDCVAHGKCKYKDNYRGCVRCEKVIDTYRVDGGKKIMTEWINVKDKLPELKRNDWGVITWEWFLVEYRDGYEQRFVYPALYNANKKIWAVYRGYGDPVYCNALVDSKDLSSESDFVSRWMPLPDFAED